MFSRRGGGAQLSSHKKGYDSNHYIQRYTVNFILEPKPDPVCLAYLHCHPARMPAGCFPVTPRHLLCQTAAL